MWVLLFEGHVIAFCTKNFPQSAKILCNLLVPSNNSTHTPL
nr:MAG TPA: hypothetical protein [Caudoviricetes sp.]